MAPPLLKLPARGDAALLLRTELLRRELLPMLLLASGFDAVCTAVSSCCQCARSCAHQNSKAHEPGLALLGCQHCKDATTH